MSLTEVDTSKKSKEKYPSYSFLKEDTNRRPSGSNIVLVHPNASIDSAHGKGTLYGDLSSAGSTHPPQGLCLLAAILRENGYSPVIIDAAPLGLDVQETAELAMKDNPRYVGITSYTATIKVSAMIAKKMKEIAGKRGFELTVIIGGPHVTFLPQKTLDKHVEFDIGVVGEGEITIVELIDALEAGAQIHSIPNLVYRNNSGTSQKTIGRSLLLDLDELPMPAWELLPRLAKHYYPAGDNIYTLPSIAIITSRGCPGKCVFCNPRGLGGKFRRHSAKYIVEMFRKLNSEFGIKSIFIADDMFVFDRQNVVEFCRILNASKGNKISWSVFARVDYVDSELLAKMKSAGCWQVGYGLESGSEKILKLINKKQSVETMEQAIKATAEAGLVVRGLFMVGNFGETRETMEETLAFIKRNPIKDFHVTCFTPMPGTVSFKIWPEYGDWDTDIDEGSTDSQHRVTFVPHGLSSDDLLLYQKRFYRTLMKPRIFFYQLRKILRPSATLYILKAGMAFMNYIIFPTKKTLSKKGRCFEK